MWLGDFCRGVRTGGFDNNRGVGRYSLVLIQEKSMAKGMGFVAAKKAIAKKEGIPAKNAGAILASSTRKASPAAKKANPNLKNVFPAKKK